MGRDRKWHINLVDNLEGNDAGEREYIHDAIEAMEHGLTANEFQMRESMTADSARNQAA